MRDPKREVVITGVGACCNLGDDLRGIAEALRHGRGGPFTRYEKAAEYNCRCQIMAPYPGDVSDGALGLKKAQGRFLGRAGRMAYRAARAALDGARLTRNDFAVVAGSGTGDVDAHIDLAQRLAQHRDAQRVLPTYIPRLMASTVSANLSTLLRTTGPSFSVSAACAGGAYNIAIAAELIERGHVDAAIAGGAEAVDLHFYVGFDSMRAYNGDDNDRPERASRPYAADRAGFIFGEAAAVVVLETRASAEARGAEILAVLSGYGMSSDGSGEMVSPNNEGARRAMGNALVHAGLTPEAIDYVNTHGTSTPLGDVSEVAAMRSIFDRRGVPYSSTKGYTGHSISAAGTLEAVFVTLMMAGKFVAPSINADPLDPALEDFAPVRVPIEQPIARAMSNSFGFGGTNVSLVLTHPSGA